MAEDRADITNLLAPILNDSETWNDLAKVIRDVFYSNVEDPIRQLSKIRHIKRGMDRKILEHTARLLGFDLTQDVLNLHKENLTKIVTQLPLFPNNNSTIYFKNFLEIILNSVIDVEYLYTEDYENFYPTPGGPLIIDGGTWFKSTHINVSMNLVDFDSLILSSGETLYQKAISLFYNFAPITLVVKELSFLIIFNVEDWPNNMAFGVDCAMEIEDLELTIY